MFHRIANSIWRYCLFTLFSSIRSHLLKKVVASFCVWGVHFTFSHVLLEFVHCLCLWIGTASSGSVMFGASKRFQHPSLVFLTDWSFQDGNGIHDPSFVSVASPLHFISSNGVPPMWLVWWPPRKCNLYRCKTCLLLLGLLLCVFVSAGFLPLI